MKTKPDDGYNATIESFFVGKEGHGINTVSITLQHDSGSHQSFGNLCLDGDKLTRSFIKDVCAIFGTTDLESLKGRRCRALYNFKGWNEMIAGIETDSGRFTINAWRKKVWPEEKITSALEQKREHVEMRLASAERQARELKAELKQIDAEYIDLGD